MKNLLLITNGFPYGEKEHSFLYLEFMELCKYFHITILAINPTAREIKYSIPSTVHIVRMCVNKKKNILNVAWQVHRREVIQEILYVLKVSESIKIAGLRISKILSYSYYADKYLKIIQKIVLDDDIDCIYTYWCTQATVAAARLKNSKWKHCKSNIKIVTRFHGYDLFQERNLCKWQCLRKYVADNLDKLVFVCEDGKEYFLKHWQVDSKKLKVFYLGSDDFGLFHATQNGELSIVSCSNLIPLKRVDLIPKALSLLNNNLKVRWTHLGSGETQKEIEGLCEMSLSSKENVKWDLRGFVENSQVCKIYRDVNAQVFITTSSSEGCPVSLQEAFSMGLPAIGTAVGGVSEVITEGETGIVLSEDPKPEEVAEKIRLFYFLPEKEKRKMGRAAREKWENTFNAKTNAKKFVKFLVDLVE